MVFRALYLMAIVFVVDGHTTLADMFTMDGLFKYYSFHLMLFAFGAGYFFRLRGSLASDIMSRAKRLLLPLYGWNLVYGVGAAVLRRVGGFEIGEPLSAYTLLLAPLVDGEHFVYNLGAWFIFPLFFVQVIYSLIRRAAKLWKDNELVTFIAALLPGVIAVSLCSAGGGAPPLPLFVMRPLILLPAYAGGMLYKNVLERHDNLPTVPYMLVVLILRALLCARYENLAYILSNCTYFACGPFGVYAGAALSIAFFLRIARLIAPWVAKSRLALYISRNTFAVMMHHYMGFFALNCVFLMANMLGFARDFSVRSFRTQAHYNYAPGGHAEFNVLYLMAGLLFPLAVAFVMDRIRALIRKNRK